jgi:hypothetical protein
VSTKVRAEDAHAPRPGPDPESVELLADDSEQKRVSAGRASMAAPRERNPPFAAASLAVAALVVVGRAFNKPARTRMHAHALSAAQPSFPPHLRIRQHGAAVVDNLKVHGRKAKSIFSMVAACSSRRGIITPFLRYHIYIYPCRH